MPAFEYDMDGSGGRKAHHAIAAFSYVGLLVLIPLLFMRRDEFAQFHAKQGLLLFAVEAVMSFVAWIPIVGWALAVAVIAAAAYGCYQACNGVRWEMPVLGTYAKELRI